MGLIAAVVIQSNEHKTLKGWTVFHLPSIRSVSHSPSAPARCRAQASHFTDVSLDCHRIPLHRFNITVHS